MKGKIGPSWSLSVVREKRRRFRGLRSFSRISRRTFLALTTLAAVAQLGADAAVAVALELVGDRPHLGNERLVRRRLPSGAA